MSRRLYSSLDAALNRIVNVADPVDAQDAATKAYADSRTPVVTRGSAPFPTKESDVWIEDVTSGLTDLAPVDVLTNAARWGWAGFGYGPGTSIVAEANGIRITWAAGIASIPGMFNDLVVNRSYRLEMLLEVPAGSPKAEAAQYMVAGGGVAKPGSTARVYLDVMYRAGQSTWLGIFAEGGSGGSVLVREFHIYDVTEALPTTRIFDAEQGWIPVRDPLGNALAVKKSGDTMTGPLILGADPTVALGAATKQYVDALGPGAWLPVTPGSGLTGAARARAEGATGVVVGAYQGTIGASGAILATLPAAVRPVFPAGSGMTFYGFTCAASSNAGFTNVRVWANGAVTVSAASGSPNGVDLSTIRFPVA